MLRPLYSIELQSLHSLAAGASASIAVPEGFTYDVRDITVYNGSLDTANLIISDTFTGAIWYAFTANPSLFSYDHWVGRQVFTANGVDLVGWEVQNNGITTIDVRISGYKLTQP
jgi:hypothetical protein